MKNIFEHTNRISFELSNICNLKLEQEFYAHGVSEISVTQYPGSVFDDRLKILDGSDVNGTTVCSAPLGDITINCKGEMAICCYDWMNMHVFGDLNNEMLSDILLSDKVAEIYSQLSNGNRTLELCKKCTGNR